MTSSASTTPFARSIVVWVTAPTRRAVRRLACRRPMPITASAKPAAQGQTDRATDQSHTDDGDRIEAFHDAPNTNGVREASYCSRFPGRGATGDAGVPLTACLGCVAQCTASELPVPPGQCSSECAGYNFQAENGCLTIRPYSPCRNWPLLATSRLLSLPVRKDYSPLAGNSALIGFWTPTVTVSFHGPMATRKPPCSGGHWILVQLSNSTSSIAADDLSAHAAVEGSR